METHPRSVRLFCVLGGMCLRNQAFQVSTEAEKQRKLEIVLRRLTGDHLTAQQRLLISRAIGQREQCSFRLSQEPGVLSGIADKENTTVCPIFGEISAPAAILVHTPSQGGMSNTIYIYLPISKERKKDDTQQEEPSDQ